MTLVCPDLQTKNSNANLLACLVLGRSAFIFAKLVYQGSHKYTVVALHSSNFFYLSMVYLVDPCVDWCFLLFSCFKVSRNETIKKHIMETLKWILNYKWTKHRRNTNSVFSMLYRNLTYKKTFSKFYFKYCQQNTTLKVHSTWIIYKIDYFKANEKKVKG